MLSELVKKQMVMLGPNISLDKARKVPGVVINDHGDIEQITGDPHVVLTGIANEYTLLSGEIAQTVFNSLLEKYPDIKAE